MKISLLLIFALPLVLLSACGEQKNEAKPVVSANNNPLEHQLEALEKAKNLEADMQKSVDDRLDAIDGQK